MKHTSFLLSSLIAAGHACAGEKQWRHSDGNVCSCEGTMAVVLNVSRSAHAVIVIATEACIDLQGHLCRVGIVGAVATAAMWCRDTSVARGALLKRLWPVCTVRSTAVGRAQAVDPHELPGTAAWGGWGPPQTVLMLECRRTGCQGTMLERRRTGIQGTVQRAHVIHPVLSFPQGEHHMLDGMMQRSGRALQPGRNEPCEGHADQQQDCVASQAATVSCLHVKLRPQQPQEPYMTVLGGGADSWR